MQCWTKNMPGNTINSTHQEIHQIGLFVEPLKAWVQFGVVEELAGLAAVLPSSQQHHLAIISQNPSSKDRESE